MAVHLAASAARSATRRAFSCRQLSAFAQVPPPSASSGVRKPRVVVLGTGWGSFACLTRLHRGSFETHVVSLSNHMLFTPLLASTAVGTLEFRSIAQPLLESCPDVVYHRARARGMDMASRTVTIETEADDPLGQRRATLPFDLLVCGMGAKNATFGVPGVPQHTHFLKTLADARRIRQALLRNVEAAFAVETPLEERRALLSVTIVGGGPTGCEFAAELHDFLADDIARLYPSAARELTITIVEGRELLSAFDASLRDFAMKRFQRDNIKLVVGAAVASVGPRSVTLGDGTQLPSGLVIWNTGIAPTEGARLLSPAVFAKDRWGHLMVDERMRVLRAPQPAFSEPPPPSATSPPAAAPAPAEVDASRALPGVFALGDACNVVGKAYAATAQVAEQQGTHLAALINAAAKQLDAEAMVPRSEAGKGCESVGAAFSEAVAGMEPFQYRHRGALAFLGRFAGIADFTRAGHVGPLSGARVKGFAAFLIWRSAYLSKLGSLRNRIQVPAGWVRTFFLGRDTTSF